MKEQEKEHAEEAVKKTGGSLGRTEDTVQIKPSEYLDLLRNRNFFRLWLGQMISAIGDWVIVAALFAYVDTLSGGKSSAISLMMVARFLPAILLGFIAGVIVDRFDRKTTMISCDLARAAVVIILPFSNSLLMICVMVFLMETFTTLYGPAKDSSIPDLVRPDQLTNANSLNSVTMFASMAFGTAIAGGIVGIIGWLGKLNPGFIGTHLDPNRSAFFLDSITFFISAYLIYRISFKEREPEQIVKFSSSQVKSDIKDGIEYMWTHELTRIVLFLVVVCFLGGGTVYVLAVGFVKYVLGGGNATFMAVLTTLLFGLMAGSLLAGLLKGFLAKEKWLGWAVFAFGTFVALFSLVAWFWLTYTLAFLAGVCMGYGVVGMITLLHETLEEEYRGRVFSTINMLMRGSIFLSIIVAGPLADLINWLGRTWGVSAQDWSFIRIGGSFAGQVDDKTVDFRYLLNGPQIILLLGGLVIMGAGYFATIRLHAYFCSPEGMNFITSRKDAVCGIETITLPEGEQPDEGDETAAEGDNGVEGKELSDPTEAGQGQWKG
jgi:MFS family permease